MDRDNEAPFSLIDRVYPWRNLRTGIALTFGVSTLLLSIILSILAGLVTRKQLRQNISGQMQETTQRTVDKLDQGMFEWYRDIQNAATFLSTQELSAAESRRLAIRRRLEQCRLA